MRAEQLSHRGRVLSHSLTEGKKEKESQLSPDDKQQILNGHDARQAKGIGIRKVEKGRDKANRGARKENLGKRGRRRGTYSRLHKAMDHRPGEASDCRYK